MTASTVLYGKSELLNDGCEYRERLGPDADAQPLPAYLSRRYPHSSHKEWEVHIASGRVLINGQPANSEPFYEEDVNLSGSGRLRSNPMHPGHFRSFTKMISCLQFPSRPVCRRFPALIFCKIRCFPWCGFMRQTQPRSTVWGDGPRALCCAPEAKRRGRN